MRQPLGRTAREAHPGAAAVLLLLGLDCVEVGLDLGVADEAA